jgi:hypothetical protein
MNSLLLRQATRIAEQGGPVLAIHWLTGEPERVGDEAEFEVIRDVFKPPQVIRVLRHPIGLIERVARD